MASCKPDDLAKWHFLLFLWYILIFWAQKCWFIELNLTLGSDAVCVVNAKYSKLKAEDFIMTLVISEAVKSP